MDALLIFDGDCAFCTSAVEFARKHLRPAATMSPWQRTDLAALGLTEEACRQAVQYRDAAGEWFSAGAAVVALVRESRRPWAWLASPARLPGAMWLVERAYEWVARNRFRLPGGTPACQL